MTGLRIFLHHKLFIQTMNPLLLIILTLVQSLLPHGSPISPLSPNLVFNASVLPNFPTNVTEISLGDWPKEPFRLRYDRDTTTTINEYGDQANPHLLDDVVTNLWDMDMIFRSQGAPDDFVMPQVLSRSHVTVRFDSEIYPHRPSIFTRGDVYKILHVLRRLIAEFGPRDIIKAEIQRDWQEVTLFSMDIWD